ncbi:hypothetical protein BJX64DRAFT_288500 [Aspergillus heterothallicus]
MTNIQTHTNLLDRLDRLCQKSIKRKVAPEEQGEFVVLTRIMRSLSGEDGESLAIGAFEDNMLEPIFGVREGNPATQILRLNENERVCLPIPLEVVLADFAKATQRSAQNEFLIRSRLDAILYLTLADSHRSALYGHDLITPAVGQHIDSVSWATEKHISQNIVYQNSCSNPNGSMDYTLWWGSPDDLETNIVVVAAKRKNASTQSCAQALVAMTMIHAVRRQTGQKDCRVFGVGTDSVDFHFLAIDSDSI